MNKIITPVGQLKYVYITGDGVDNSFGGPPKFQYSVSIVYPKGSQEHQTLEKILMEIWEEFRKQRGLKIKKPKFWPIKEELVKDPEGKLDPETGEVQKIPTGNVIVTFKTNTTWPDGSKKIIRVYDYKGRDITNIIQAAADEAKWYIGNGSLGRIIGSPKGNTTGGTPKLSLYLTGLQLAKLVKYEPVMTPEPLPEGEEINEIETDTPEPIDL